MCLRLTDPHFDHRMTLSFLVRVLKWHCPLQLKCLSGGIFAIQCLSSWRGLPGSLKDPHGIVSSPITLYYPPSHLTPPTFHFQLSCFWYVLFLSLLSYTWVPQNQPFLLSIDNSFSSLLYPLLQHSSFKIKSVDICTSNSKPASPTLAFTFIVLIAVHYSSYRSNALWRQESCLACSDLYLTVPIMGVEETSI